MEFYSTRLYLISLAGLGVLRLLHWSWHFSKVFHCVVGSSRECGLRALYHKSSIEEPETRNPSPRNHEPFKPKPIDPISLKLLNF